MIAILSHWGAGEDLQNQSTYARAEPMWPTVEETNYRSSPGISLCIKEVKMRETAKARINMGQNETGSFSMNTNRVCACVHQHAHMYCLIKPYDCCTERWQSVVMSTSASS